MTRPISIRARGGSPALTNAPSLRPRWLLCGLAVVFLILLSSTTVTVAQAATVTRNPTIVDHFGDTVPLTMYMRLKRQTRKSFFFQKNPADAALDLEVGEVIEDQYKRVLAVDPEKRENAGAGAVPDEWNVRDLELPSLGAITSKHRSQIIRNLPPAYAPRFGINRAVTLMANATLRAAGKTLEVDETLQQSDLAVRFSVGRGLQKESTWLPLASRHRVVNLLSELLRDRLEAEGGAAEVAARLTRAEIEEEFARVAKTKDASAVHYLSRVTFYFGYQTGEQHKLTSFAMEASYSVLRKPGIELHFIWDEHRPYNPNRALVLCSAASLLVTVIMVMVVFHPSSRSMRLFSQRIVAVRAHE